MTNYQLFISWLGGFSHQTKNFNCHLKNVTSCEFYDVASMPNSTANLNYYSLTGKIMILFSNPMFFLEWSQKLHEDRSRRFLHIWILKRWNLLILQKLPRSFLEQCEHSDERIHRHGNNAFLSGNPWLKYSSRANIIAKPDKNSGKDLNTEQENFMFLFHFFWWKSA